MKFRLTRNERRNLSRFVKRTRGKMEYARGSAILMRSKGMKVKQVAGSLQVCMGAVFRWERLYRRKGLDALRGRKPTGRPAVRGDRARGLIPGLLRKDPQAFGFLKGRWVVRDISKALKQEGVDISPTQVHGILRDLGLSYKRPKLDVESDDPSFARKKREVRSYQRMAPALAKRG
ncbi:MAG: helix-turn-helix domain-containing protein [Nitrososphaerota archaeon]|nr:helix-turn-helix domain-containing protein [Nitrososphaerota archaeon]